MKKSYFKHNYIYIYTEHRIVQYTLFEQALVILSSDDKNRMHVVRMLHQHSSGLYLEDIEHQYLP